jgi:hypothetical protein
VCTGQLYFLLSLNLNEGDSGLGFVHANLRGTVQTLPFAVVLTAFEEVMLNVYIPA